MSQDPYAALAAIFLGDAPALDAPALDRGALLMASVANRSATAAPAREAQPERLLSITAVLTGHLPVMAGLWTTQFADRVGERDGPTCLVRFDRDLVHVEILRAGGRHIGVQPGENLLGWTARAASLVRRWVICLPVGADPEVLFDPALAEIVMLTSADEAATAAAAQRIREVAAVAQRLEAAPPSVGLAVLGAPPERVEWMIDELSRAVGKIGVDLPVHASFQRMDRVESSERYGFEAATSPAVTELLRHLQRSGSEAIRRFEEPPLRLHRAPPPRAGAFAPPQLSIAPAAPPDPSREDRSRAARSGSLTATPITAAPIAAAPLAATPLAAAPLTATPLAAAPLTATTSAAPATHAASAPSEPVAQSPSETPGTSVAPNAAAAPSRFAALIPGLTPLPLSCPIAPAVELATDSCGRLHLLCDSRSAHLLRNARAWSGPHAPLLGAAFPQLRTEGGLAIVEHVVTSDAPSVARLHGTGVLLHLLLADDAASWRHIALNDEASAIPAAPSF